MFNLFLFNQFGCNVFEGFPKIIWNQDIKYQSVYCGFYSVESKVLRCFSLNNDYLPGGNVNPVDNPHTIHVRYIDLQLVVFNGKIW